MNCSSTQYKCEPLLALCLCIVSLLEESQLPQDPQVRINTRIVAPSDLGVGVLQVTHT